MLRELSITELRTVAFPAVRDLLQFQLFLITLRHWTANRAQLAIHVTRLISTIWRQSDSEWIRPLLIASPPVQWQTSQSGLYRKFRMGFDGFWFGLEGIVEERCMMMHIFLSNIKTTILLYLSVTMNIVRYSFQSLRRKGLAWFSLFWAYLCPPAARRTHEPAAL